jgi:PAS domain-containing protein
MPFSDQFKNVYELAIKPACKACRSDCSRVDDEIFTEKIIDRVFRQIRTADVLIAEMSGRNHNVFFEAGYAKALDTPVIYLTDNADDIPFDLKQEPHIVYDAKDLSGLRTQIKQKLAWLLKHPPREIPSTLVGMEAVIRASKRPMYFADTKLVVRHCNPALEAFFDMTRAEIIGKGLEQLLEELRDRIPEGERDAVVEEQRSRISKAKGKKGAHMDATEFTVVNPDLEDSQYGKLLTVKIHSDKITVFDKHIGIVAVYDVKDKLTGRTWYM